LLDLLEMEDARQKILVVDDNEEDRFLLLQALTDAGLDCEIRHATDGEEAERCLLGNLNDGELPHIVILDMRLPKRSGRQVMEKLHTAGITKHTRVIVLSSVLPDGDMATLQALGAWGVFEKPSDLDEFVNLGRLVKELSQKDAILQAGTLNQNVEPPPNFDSAQSFPPQASTIR
jgi:CheY-like chemotaxis protein